MNNQNTAVILVHGFYSDPSSCHYLARVLGAEYPVFPVELDLTYSNLDQCIEALLKHTEQILNNNSGARLCFIGHSTGGLVIRGLLQRYVSIANKTFAALMVAAPNRGTVLADLHEKLLPEILRIHKPIAHISRLAQQAANCRCPDHILLMGFAGVKSWAATRHLFGGVNDGVVAASSVRLDQMEDLVLLPSDHLQIMGNFALAKAVLFFLKHLSLPPQLYRLNRMDLAKKFRLICESHAVDEFIALARGNVETATMGGKTYWNNLIAINGWKLQQNKLFKNVRLLNQSDTRKAWGSYNRFDEMMDTVIAKLQAEHFVQEKPDAGDPLVERLERLKALLDKGLISNQEYESKRSELLSGI